MGKHLRLMGGVALFVALALAGAVGVFAFGAAQSVQANQHSAERDCRRRWLRVQTSP